MNTDPYLPTSALQELLAWLKGEQEGIARARRGGFLPRNRLGNLKSDVQRKLNNPPFVGARGTPADTQELVEASHRHLGRGLPEELDRFIGAVERVLERRGAKSPEAAEGAAARRGSSP